MEGLGKDLGRFGRILSDLGALDALGAIVGFFSGFFACIFKRFMQFYVFWTSQAARWRVRTVRCLKNNHLADVATFGAFFSSFFSHIDFLAWGCMLPLLS